MTEPFTCELAIFVSHPHNGQRWPEPYDGGPQSQKAIDTFSSHPATAAASLMSTNWPNKHILLLLTCQISLLPSHLQRNRDQSAPWNTFFRPFINKVWALPAISSTCLIWRIKVPLKQMERKVNYEQLVKFIKASNSSSRVYKFFFEYWLIFHVKIFGV